MVSPPPSEGALPGVMRSSPTPTWLGPSAQHAATRAPDGRAHLDRSKVCPRTRWFAPHAADPVDLLDIARGGIHLA